MTRTKRIFLTLLIFLGIGIGVFATLTTSSVVYAAESEETTETTTNDDWGEWVKQELVPYAVLAISAISTIIVAVSPVLAKVKKASDKFKEATSGVNDTKLNGDESIKKIETFVKQTEEELQGVVDDISNKFKAFDERIEKIEQAATNTEQITRIGFGNMEELVKKGYAAEIEKVGKNGKDEETTES